MNLFAPIMKYRAHQASSEMLLRVLIRVAVLAVALWAGFTVALVWYQTGRQCGPQAHDYFGEWIVAWFLTEPLPIPFATLPYHGQRYPVASLFEFLNRTIFVASPPAWFRYYALWGLLPHAAAAMSMLGWSLLSRFELSALRSSRWSSVTNHVRGLRLVSGRRLNRRLRGTGIALGGVRVPRARESEHFLIAGATGTGKSVAIRTMLRQIEQRRETAVVVDPDCEFVPEFYRPERGDLVLNPLDARCPTWSPWAELDPERREVDSEMLAAAFIPDPPGPHSEDGSAFFFRQSSRTLIMALLKVAQPAVPATLPRLLNLSRTDLRQQLTGTAAEPLIDPGAHDQGAGIVATAANAINPLRYRSDRTKPPWSAREWSQHARGWLFLTSRDDLAAAITPLLSVWLDCIVRRLLARSHAPSRRVWIVIDELAALKRQAQLENLLVRGRKRDLSAVVGFQTISQLRAIYGREPAAVLSSMPSTKLLFRVDEPETAQFLSRQIGEREISRDQPGTSASDDRASLSLHTHQLVEPLVLTSEIQGLPRLTGFLCVAGADRARVTIPLCVARPRQAAFVPASRALTGTWGPDPEGSPPALPTAPARQPIFRVQS